MPQYTVALIFLFVGFMVYIWLIVIGEIAGLLLVMFIVGLYNLIVLCCIKIDKKMELKMKVIDVRRFWENEHLLELILNVITSTVMVCIWINTEAMCYYWPSRDYMGSLEEVFIVRNYDEYWDAVRSTWQEQYRFVTDFL